MRRQCQDCLSWPQVRRKLCSKMSICVLACTDQTPVYTITSLGEIHGRLWRGKRFQCCGQSSGRGKSDFLNFSKPPHHSRPHWIVFPIHHLLLLSLFLFLTCISLRPCNTFTFCPLKFYHIFDALRAGNEREISRAVRQVFCLLGPPHMYFFATADRTMNLLIQLQTSISPHQEKRSTNPTHTAH